MIMWFPRLVIFRKAVSVTTSSQLSGPVDQPVGQADVPPGLLARLGALADPRRRQGRRHPYASILAVCACAVAAVGNDSFTAIAEWARRASQQTLAVLGVWRDPFTGLRVPPSERTIRRTVAKADIQQLEDTVAEYLVSRAPATPRPTTPAQPTPQPEQPAEPAPRPTTPAQPTPQPEQPAEPAPAEPAVSQPAGTPATGRGMSQPLEREQRRQLRRDQNLPARTVLAPGVAIDGKRLAGARGKDGRHVQLLSATRHTGPVIVLGQRRIGTKTNEIPEFIPLTTGMDLKGCVVTTDALHTQRKTARWIVEDLDADYIMIIRENQHHLLAAARKALTGTDDEFADTTHTTDEKGHGRTERRRVRVAPAVGTTFPHAAQFIRIIRRTGGPDGVFTTKQIVYAVTSSTPERAGPDALSAHIRNHWTCENKTHYVRDVTFNEDRSQVRTGSAPQALAALRNLVIGVFRIAGYANMAFARRECGNDNTLILRLFNLLPNTA
jgi:predicted transposase YbfD/YdcC